MNGASRIRLAAVNASNGALTVGPDGRRPGERHGPHPRRLQGRRRRRVHRTSTAPPVYGLGAVDASTGALAAVAGEPDRPGLQQRPGCRRRLLQPLRRREHGLRHGYVLRRGGGNLEGAFATNPRTGRSTGSRTATATPTPRLHERHAVYTVSHAHYCGNVSGFPQTNPLDIRAAPRRVHGQRHGHARAQHVRASTRTSTASRRRPCSTGSPTSPSAPTPAPGRRPGASPATAYLVMGGEFPSVNGVAQQGLVRFAVPVDGAEEGAAAAVRTEHPARRHVALQPGSVRVTWPANWDRDDTDPDLQGDP